MGTLLRILGVWVLAVGVGGAGVARAQFAPPTPAGENDAGSSAASPGIGVSIAPPVVPVETATHTVTPGRASQTFTTDLLMGRVGDRPVFAQELFEPVDEKLRHLGQTAKSLEEFRGIAGSLIQNELLNLEGDILFQEAAEAVMTQSDKDMLDRLVVTKKKDLLSEHGGSAAAAEKALEATGSTIERYLDQQRREFIRGFYYSKYIYPRIQITRPMVVARYEKNPKRWQQPAQVELYMITLRIRKWLHEPTQNGELGSEIAHPTPEQIQVAEAQAIGTAKDLVAKLKNGGDFAQLAEDYSEDAFAKTGGRAQGMISKGSLSSPELDNYVFSLPANTLGEPQLIRGKDFANTAVVIVKVGKRTEAQTISFAAAQAQIMAELESEQRNELRDQLMVKLQRRAARERVDQMMSVAVDAAVTRYFVK